MKKYFSTGEKLLWGGSVALILLSFCVFDRVNYLTLAASLIVLWVWASVTDISYLSVVVCFVAFLANDVYGYISWEKMKRRQMENK